MYRFYLIICSILLLGCSQNRSESKINDLKLNKIPGNKNISYESMSAGFHHPPDDVRMKSYWIWLNGQVTKESITNELEGMKSKGYGGAVICHALATGLNTLEVAHGADFASAEW